MPKRQLIKRVDSSKVQGKGSWVEFRKLNYGEQKQLQADMTEHKDDREWLQKNGEDMLMAHVVAWNWCDENELAMPIPSADPTVLENLTDDEVEFLGDLFKSKADPN